MCSLKVICITGYLSHSICPMDSWMVLHFEQNQVSWYTTRGMKRHHKQLTLQLSRTMACFPSMFPTASPCSLFSAFSSPSLRSLTDPARLPPPQCLSLFPAPLPRSLIPLFLLSDPVAVLCVIWSLFFLPVLFPLTLSLSPSICSVASPRLCFLFSNI